MWTPSGKTESPAILAAAMSRHAALLQTPYSTVEATCLSRFNLLSSVCNGPQLGTTINLEQRFHARRPGALLSIRQIQTRLEVQPRLAGGRRPRPASGLSRCMSGWVLLLSLVLSLVPLWLLTSNFHDLSVFKERQVS